MSKYYNAMYNKILEVVATATESLKEDTLTLSERQLMDNAVNASFEIFCNILDGNNELYDAVLNYEIRRDLQDNDVDAVVADTLEWMYAYLPDLENNPSKELIEKANKLDNFFNSFCILNKIDLSDYDRADTITNFIAALEKAIEG